MTQEGKIVRLEGDKAFISVTRASACAHDCSKCGSACHEKKQIVVPVENGMGARLGDFVTVESPTKQILKQAFLVYLIPIFTFLASLVALQLFNADEMTTVLVSVIVLLGTAGAGMLYDRQVGKSGKIPIIIRINTEKRDFSGE